MWLVSRTLVNSWEHFNSLLNCSLAASETPYTFSRSFSCHQSWIPQVGFAWWCSDYPVSPGFSLRHFWLFAWKSDCTVKVACVLNYEMWPIALCPNPQYYFTRHQPTIESLENLFIEREMCSELPVALQTQLSDSVFSQPARFHCKHLLIGSAVRQ